MDRNTFLIALVMGAFDAAIPFEVILREPLSTAADGRFTKLANEDDVWIAANEGNDIEAALRMAATGADPMPSDEIFTAAVERVELALALGGGLLPGLVLNDSPRQDGGSVKIVKGNRELPDAGWSDALVTALSVVADVVAGAGRTVQGRWDMADGERQYDTIDETDFITLHVEG